MCRKHSDLCHKILLKNDVQIYIYNSSDFKSAPHVGDKYDSYRSAEEEKPPLLNNNYKFGLNIICKFVLNPPENADFGLSPIRTLWVHLFCCYSKQVKLKSKE